MFCISAEAVGLLSKLQSEKLRSLGDAECILTVATAPRWSFRETNALGVTFGKPSTEAVSAILIYPLLPLIFSPQARHWMLECFRFGFGHSQMLVTSGASIEADVVSWPILSSEFIFRSYCLAAHCITPSAHNHGTLNHTSVSRAPFLILFYCRQHCYSNDHKVY